MEYTSENADDVSATDIDSTKVLFIPDTKIKAKLAKPEYTKA